MNNPIEWKLSDLSTYSVDDGKIYGVSYGNDHVVIVVGWISDVGEIFDAHFVTVSSEHKEMFAALINRT